MNTDLKKREAGEPGIRITGLKKSFGDKKVTDIGELELKAGGTYALMGRSGIGKTTLLRLIAGLEKNDGGDITFITGDGKAPSERKDVRFSFVFQEDRLCEYLSAEENLYLVSDGFSRDAFQVKELLRLLPEDSLKRPVRELSGGQKRRVAVVRAMSVTEADIILMDEPFTGMDEDTKKLTADYIRKKKKKRLLIISTHSREEAGLLDAEIIDMESLQK